jgi:hypothetical protein
MSTRRDGAGAMLASTEPDHVTRSDRGELRSRELLTVHDVATLLHVPVSWVYEHTRRGAPDALPVVKVGKYVRFRPADLWDYIDRKSRVTTSR